jgi:6-phosphofructokinase 1
MTNSPPTMYHTVPLSENNTVQDGTFVNTLGILTSGGDSPGMNAAIWAATQHLEGTGWHVLGVREGFTGLLRGDVVPLTPGETLKCARYGGTFLGTSRDPDFTGKIAQATSSLERAGITHLMVIGGNGSLRGAAALERAGVRVVGLPGTIDNDVAGSDDSIGFDTAANFGLLILDQFRDTLESLPRLCALETLGGNTGFLAERIGATGGADMILVPEKPMTFRALAAGTRQAMQQHGFALIVASEGYPNLENILRELEADIGVRLRFSRPSHAMRGGRPTTHDRMLARALAITGVNALARGQMGAVVWRAGRTKLVPFSNLPKKKRFARETP